MRLPHSSLVIWIQLEHGQDRTRFHLEQGYASGVCAGQATPLISPKCLSTKNRYALNLCARVSAKVCVEVEAPAGYLGQYCF